MKLPANATTINLKNKILLQSYETVVAYFDKNLKEFFKSDEFHSQTTSKHINKFIGELGGIPKNAIEVPQEQMNMLLSEMG